MAAPLLGAEEERQLFAADGVRAIMQWPPGYSVNAADWVTETNDAFTRPLSHFVGEFLSVPAAARPATPLRSSSSSRSSRQQQRGRPWWGSMVGPDSNGGPGLFTEALLFREPQGAPEGRGPPPSGSCCCSPVGGGPPQQQQQQQQEWHGPPTSGEELDVAASDPSAFLQQQSSRGLNRSSRRSRQGRRATVAAAGLKTAAERQGSAGFCSSCGAPQGPQMQQRRSLSQQQTGEGPPVGHRSYRNNAAVGSPAAQGAPNAAAASCKLLLQRQKDVLKQQYQQVEQLRKQLQELEQALATLQLQGNANNLQQQQQQQQQQKQQLAFPRVSGPSLTLSDLQPVDSIEEEDSVCWSLDPRDYKNMTAASVQWIPPAGISSRHSEH